MSKPRLRAPEIPLALIEWLERLYPDKLPESSDITARAFGELVGQQNVIRSLRNEYRRQTGDEPPF